LENWQPTPGMDATAAEARRTELLQQVRQAQPVAGQSLEASFPPVRSDPLLFNTGVVAPQPEPEPPADETPAPADEAPTGDVPPQDDDGSADAVGDPDPAVTLPNPLGETGLHTADGLPDGVQNLVPDASGLVDDFDAMAGIGGDTPADMAADSSADVMVDVVSDAPMQDATLPSMDDIDVLGDMQVADVLVDQPAMADVAAAPTYDQAPPLDDLGLDTPVLVDDFTDDFTDDLAAAVPQSDTIGFDEPDFEPATSDFADPEPEPEPVGAADDGSDDLGLT
jgi:hypothetical protein